MGNSDPAIYLIRDGRDTLVSYAHFILQAEYGIPIGSNREAFVSMLRQLIVGQDRFGGWSANALVWKRRDPAPALIHFEDLIADPAKALVPALSAVGLLAEPEGEVPGFETLRQASPTLFRRGKIGSCQDEMPAELHDLFWKYHAEAMDAFHYTRESAGSGVSEDDPLNRHQTPQPGLTV